MAWELQYLRNPTDTDILVCVPNTGTVRIDWAFSLKHLNMPPGLGFVTRGNQGQPIDIARNLFVTQALQHRAKFMFFLDSDIEMPHDGLVKLWETRKPIISGLYCTRSPPYALTANVNRKALMPEIMYKFPNVVIDVQEIGMGCCLIDMRAIAKIAKKMNMKWRCMKLHGKELGVPESADLSQGHREVAVFSNEEAFDLLYQCGYCKGSLLADFFRYTIGTAQSSEQQHGPFSEDFYFCSLARKCGIPISIHTGIFCNHEMVGMKITKEGLTNQVASAAEI